MGKYRVVLREEWERATIVDAPNREEALHRALLTDSSHPSTYRGFGFIRDTHPPRIEAYDYDTLRWDRIQRIGRKSNRRKI